MEDGIAGRFNAVVVLVTVNPPSFFCFNVIEPENPSIDDAVTVDVHEAPPSTTATKNGLELMSKSGPFTLMMTSTLLERLPLVPVTVISYTPGGVPPGALTVSVDVSAGGRDTVPILNPPVRPVGDEGLAVRATMPVKPLTGVTVIVELLVDPPATIVRNSGFAEIPKFGPVTVTDMSAKWNRLPLLASNERV